MKKLEKILCEICGESNKSTLHKHHIVHRTDINTSNHEFNLAVICSNCHEKVHDNLITIIGIFPSTKLPYGRTLVYEIDGKKNMDLENPYYIHRKKSMEIYEKKDNS